MIGFRVKRFFVKTLGLGPAVPKALFDGPPENPEYFMLAGKPGARYADKGPSVYQLVDETEAQRLRKLRFEHYLERFPHKRGTITEKDDVLRFHDAVVDPDHVPKFCEFRKKVSFATNTFTPLSVIYGMDCPFVRPAFIEAVEAVAPGLLQFFPYQCRLRSGDVFAEGYLMHWSRRIQDPVDRGRTGLGPNTDSQLWAQRLHNGQVVIRPSLLDGTAMQIFGLAHQAIYSRQLAVRLGPALGRNEQFYPVHVYDGL
jgi:hypothetical protein